jgi:hypothetical protein
MRKALTGASAAAMMLAGIGFAAPAMAGPDTSNVTICNDSGAYCLQNEGNGAAYQTQNLTSTTFSTTGNTMTSGGHTYYQWEDSAGRCLGYESGNVIAAACAKSSTYEYFWYDNSKLMVNLGQGCDMFTDPVGNGATVQCGSGTGLTAAELDWTQS